jgi:uncharacterized membrane protein (UPF0127 family)
MGGKSVPNFRAALRRYNLLFAPSRVALGFVLLGLTSGCGSAAGAGAEVGTEEDESVRTSSAIVGDEAGMADDQEGPGRGMAWVILGADTVTAEVAASAEERRQGLMYREELPDGTGMLFVFPDEAVRSFWMQNTYIALDIAFLDSRTRIVDIKQMEPESTELHDSSAPSMFALEVRKGWLEENGIRVGLQAEIVFGAR